MPSSLPSNDALPVPSYLGRYSSRRGFEQVLGGEDGRVANEQKTFETLAKHLDILARGINALARMSLTAETGESAVSSDQTVSSASDTTVMTASFSVAVPARVVFEAVAEVVPQNILHELIQSVSFDGAAAEWSSRLHPRATGGSLQVITKGSKNVEPGASHTLEVKYKLGGTPSSYKLVSTDGATSLTYRIEPRLS